jgi:tetratricopeptide (TPR) repeat protein
MITAVSAPFLITCHMLARTVSVVNLAIFLTVVGLGQQPAQQAPIRSHVERFSSPETRAEQAEAEASKRLASNPSDADSLNARALARMRLGRYSDAFTDLQQAVTLSPKNAGYLANLGYVLWKLGKPSAGIAAERSALGLDEKNVTAQFQLGRFLVRTGDQRQMNEAVSHLRKTLELDPRQYDARLELIAAYRSLGDTSQAMTQLELLQDARPSDPNVTYVAALLSADRGDLKGAIEGFRRVLKLDPTLFAAEQDLGLAHVRLNQWQEAEAVFADLTTRQASSADAGYFHALSLYNLGHINEAETEARRTLRLNAGSSGAHTLLGIILASRGGANAEAADALLQAIALDSRSFDAYFYLGRVLYAQRDYAGSVQNLKKAVELNPKHGQARFFLGTVFEAAGESSEAVAQYEQLVKDEADSAMGQLGLGAVMLKQGRSAEAVAALRRAVSLGPKAFEARLVLGRALALSNNYDEAVTELTAAVSLAPERADAHYQLGLALRRVGKTDEAAREFATTDKLNSDFREGKRP